MDKLSENLSNDAVLNIKKWLTEPKYAEYKSELESMIAAEDWQQLEDSFFQVIEFGTGGRRGKTGIGSNRINNVTVGESAQALCEYVLSLDASAAQKGIVIGFDTRLSSPELSRMTAEVVAANGFKTYIFDSFRSTPELSFAVRHLNCAAGIVISASHNPPSDNGFKAYWSDGCQLTAPHDKGVLAVADKINEIKTVDFEMAIADGKITIIGKELDDAYISAASSEASGVDRNISIVYSPLHGSGQTNVLPVLKAVGFNNISVVEAQMVPDGNFPTIPSGKPNPEERSTNDMAVNQMLAESADIAITNDPDADRIGLIVNQSGKAVYLNGNQTAILATDYSLQKLQEKGKLLPDNYIVKTIVTTDALNALADYYGINIYDNLLIGFKYIGELIRSKENTSEKFIIGGEESFGLLKGTYARDKDGASGALPIAEYAAELKKSGKTLYDRLLEIYKQHGLYVEKLDTMVCPGASGFEQMKNIMASLRNSAPKTICGHYVTAVLDYSNLTKLDTVSGRTSTIDCLNGNVLVLEFGDHRNRVTIRPSGTEPKLKFYVQWHADVDSSKDIELQYQTLENHLAEIIAELEKILSSL